MNIADILTSLKTEIVFGREEIEELILEKLYKMGYSDKSKIKFTWNDKQKEGGYHFVVMTFGDVTVSILKN